LPRGVLPRIGGANTLSNGRKKKEYIYRTRSAIFFSTGCSPSTEVPQLNMGLKRAGTGEGFLGVPLCLETFYLLESAAPFLLRTKLKRSHGKFDNTLKGISQGVGERSIRLSTRGGVPIPSANGKGLDLGRNCPFQPGAPPPRVSDLSGEPLSGALSPKGKICGGDIEEFALERWLLSFEKRRRYSWAGGERKLIHYLDSSSQKNVWGQK